MHKQNWLTGALKRSVIIGIIVGTLLNLINQGNVLFGDGELSVAKAVLTYCVPFCVSMLSTWLMVRSHAASHSCPEEGNEIEEAKNA